MKMSRSHCETENVQLIQELAEVDGPFESPININFKDLTKLELPCLVWNRSDVCPSKMKITNTGHTVIISGKWKCERPYLIGGPLIGKYVFSQIHFHWGPDDCKGSEHQVCGEGFPLEMHVAHFKTDYLTQECALREKDGMVILVYLFKIQEEPNNSLKRILTALPSIHQPGSSQQLDPRPILSLCHPFTDDYFMYWGSVVTSTCAHILMWLVCREPFGISKDQMCEFRKILDSSQRPINRNNRECQPLHKRNVFHVNASKNLDCPMLPIRRIIGCFCGRGEEAAFKSKNCSCQGSRKTQEEIEGPDRVRKKLNIQRNFFVHQSLFVQRATVHSAPLLPKLFENTYLGQLWTANNSAKQPLSLPDDPNLNMVSKSCCFIPVKEFTQITTHPEKRRMKRKSFNSTKALSHILESLETLKNQTIKKLKEIDSLNQEIKGIKSFCKDIDDKKWLRKIEKIVCRQKRFTIKTSQSCLGELKKLAKDCNFDQFFDGKLVSFSDSNNKTVWVNNLKEERNWSFTPDLHRSESVQEVVSKNFNVNKAMKFSNKAQKLIKSFFEDIQESEEFQLTLQNDLNLLKKSISLKSQNTVNTASLRNMEKGLITQKMFTLQNLGDRFFIEVPSENMEGEEEEEDDDDDDDDDDDEEEEEEKGEKRNIENETNSINLSPLPNKDDVNIRLENSDEINNGAKNDFNLSKPQLGINEVIPLHRVEVDVEFPRYQKCKVLNNLVYDEDCNSLSEGNPNNISLSELISHSSASSTDSFVEYNMKLKSPFVNTLERETDLKSKLLSENAAHSDCANVNFQNSTSNASFNSSETQRMIIAKLYKKQLKKKNSLKSKSSVSTRKSFVKVNLKGPSKKRKLRNINVEGYYIKKKNDKSKNKAKQNTKSIKESDSTFDLSSMSKNDFVDSLKGKLKHVKKAKFKVKIEKTSDTSMELPLDNSCSILNFNEVFVQGSCENIDRKISDTQAFSENSIACVNSPILGDSFTQLSQNGGDNLFNSVALKDHSGSFTGLKESHNNDNVVDSRDLKENSLENDLINDLLGTALIKIDEGTREVRSLDNISKPKSLTKFSRFKHRAFDISNRLSFSNAEGNYKNQAELLDIKNKLENLKKEDKTVQMQEFTSNFFTVTNQFGDDENLLNKVHLLDINSHLTSRGGIEKYHFLDKELQEIKSMQPCNFVLNEELKPDQEALSRMESRKSFASIEANLIGDINSPTADHKELSDTVSYTPMKKNPQSRAHSVENLNVLTKTKKKKHKKRPHCSKRISKHYMRKNSYVLKKPNKVDNKGTHFLNLSNEEQLKIISVNVAKYLKLKIDDLNFDDRSIFRQLEKASKELQEKLNKTETGEGISHLNISPKNSISAISALKCSTQNIQESFSFKNISCESGNIMESDSEQKETSNETDKSISPRFNRRATHTKSNASKSTTNLEENLEVNALNNENFSPKNNGEQIREEKELKIKQKITKIVGQKRKLVEPRKIQKSILKTEMNESNLTATDTTKDKKTGSLKPPLNFIKLNKLMAGKYKKSNASGETKSEIPELSKKGEHSKIAIFKRRIGKTAKPTEKKEPTTQNSLNRNSNKETKTTDKKNVKKMPRGKQKSTNVTKKGAAEKKKTENSKHELSIKMQDEKTKAKKNLVSKMKEISGIINNKEKNELKSSEMPYPKIPMDAVSAYMMTSLMPTSTDETETPQKNMSQFLVNVQNKNGDHYLPDVIYDSKNFFDAKTKKSESVFAKDLENLIKLQMCLNNEIAANIENSMNYIKTILSQDYAGAAMVEKTPTNETIKCFDSSQSGIILIEMNDAMDGSTTGSDCAEEVEVVDNIEVSNKKKGKLETSGNKESICESKKVPTGLENSHSVTPFFIQDSKCEEEYNSDSSYNCEISITLNGQSSDVSNQIHSKTICSKESANQFSNTLIRKDSSLSQLTTQTDHCSSSNSVIHKSVRKKRKDNEISLEMKKKLLEILEGEIKREMALNYTGSSDNVSDALTLRLANSSLMSVSQCTDSVSDHTETLVQISETMRQYLCEYKKRRLEKANESSLDKIKSGDET